MDRPKVSICIPAYRQLEYLRKTLESIRIQDFRNFELIVTDDTPDDAVEKLLEEFNFGTQLRYHKNEIRLGSPENWNAAMRLAKGEYIKIMHHDDWFTYPDSLRCFVEGMEKNPECFFGFSASLGYDASKGSTRKNSPSAEFLAELRTNPSILFFGNLVGAPSVTIFRNPTSVFFDNRLIWVVDSYFYIQVIEKEKRFVFIERELITSVSGVSHSITSQCLTKDVLVFEYFYLYSNTEHAVRDDGKYIRFFANIFVKYNINLNQLKALTGASKFDPNIRKALFLKKINLVRIIALAIRRIFNNIF